MDRKDILVYVIYFLEKLHVFPLQPTCLSNNNVNNVMPVHMFTN